jgi:ribosome-interacting GTPase 1
MGILEKIADIEAEVARTQKNKGAPHSQSLNQLSVSLILCCA